MGSTVHLWEYGAYHYKGGFAMKLQIVDTSTAGLLQQALDLYAKEDDVPSDVAELVERLRERLVELIG